MRSFDAKQSQKGQVLLLVVLASVIALTVGLAAVSRSITSTRISTEESNSQKALSAAEAGVEEQINRALSGGIALGDEQLINQNIGNNASFISEAEPVEPGANIPFEVNNGDTIPQDEGADIWLSDYRDFSSPTRTQLTIYWVSGNCSASATNPEAAIEVAIIYGNAANPSMNRYTADRCSRGNSFPLANAANLNRPGFKNTYNRSMSIPLLPSAGFIARVIPLYGSTSIAAVSSAPLPVQGYIIESTGESGTTRRKLQVYQGFPKLPIEFFPYNLFLP